MQLFARLQVLFLLVLGIFALPITSVAARNEPMALPVPQQGRVQFRCDAKVCAMPSQGAYPYLIMGVFQAAATAAQSRQLYQDMRQLRRWMQLPADASGFYHQLQAVSISLPKGQTLAVLMSQIEFHAAQPQPGDLVRYSPHFGPHELPPSDAKERAYWAIDGCVAVICRAQDHACFQRYVQGVYRRSDGVAIAPDTFSPLPHQARIDVLSLLPQRP